jgi:hypothetical protein
MQRIIPPPPKLSPDFTLEDIRKIRDYQYELEKVLTPEEIQERRDSACKRIETIIAEKRAKGVKPIYPKRIEV